MMKNAGPINVTEILKIGGGTAMLWDPSCPFHGAKI